MVIWDQIYCTDYVISSWLKGVIETYTAESAFYKKLKTCTFGGGIVDVMALQSY